MTKSELVKEKIITVTIALIQGGSGNIEEITTRLIAKQAGVGIGLINYHFESKDKLIEICVQRIIAHVIEAFKPDTDNEINPIKRLKKVATQVMDFLIANPSVSRISITGDMNSPKIMDNTMKTVMGFLISIVNYNISEEEKRLLLFSLTAVLQAGFLRKEIIKDSFGFDFNNKEERDNFICFIIDKLFEGGRLNG